LLDRDGVINRRRLDHVKAWGEFEFLPGVLEALAELRRTEVPVVVLTNQAAVGRGLLTADELAYLHSRMVDAVREAGGEIEGIYVCPHVPQARCACRKPATDLFLRASADLGITLPGSVMVGDDLTDVQAARSVGCQPILITNGSPTRVDGVPNASDLTEAVALIPALLAESARC
jgi:histidinol-phosphate phosphatase family protein